MPTVIQVNKLSKSYLIGHQKNERYTALRDVIAHGVRGLAQRIRHPFSPNREMVRLEEFWALKDINLEIEQGERVGIIGRNGAGKSTLLKILSRITEPTKGGFMLKGRVASLLEVGTGFHPELSGRENVYLNGAILGMTKKEIKKKFDEIVAFADVEKFLDTPVKRYSSGMHVRLAFAVAAHLESEILIVDEVLAVGDFEFQKKCLGKMAHAAGEGRTVLFVSHNVAAVQRLCSRAVLISSGSIEIDGPVADTISSYLYEKERGNIVSSRKIFYDHSTPGDEFVKLRGVRMLSTSGAEKSIFSMDEEFLVEIDYQVLKSLSDFHLYVRIHTDDGVLAFCSADWDNHHVLQHIHHDSGQYKSGFKIPSNFLNTGIYSLTVVGVIPSVRVIFEEPSVLVWEINSTGGAGGLESISRRGVFRPLLKWF